MISNFKKIRNTLIPLFVIMFFIQVNGQSLDQFNSVKSSLTGESTIKNSFQFNGYTNHWHNDYKQWHRYGNLFKIAVPDLQPTILQSKIDIAEDLGLPGLLMQEGFISKLISESYKTIKNPTSDELDNALKNGNILVVTDPQSDVGKQLEEKGLVIFEWAKNMKSHQLGAVNLEIIKAFYLVNDNQNLFIISSTSRKQTDLLLQKIESTKEVLVKYDLHKGWFGAYTLLNSVTCTPGHPLEVMGAGMNEGCSWFVFEGYMDFLSKDEITNWVESVNLPIVTDFGATQVYGCKDYDGFQIQQMYTHDIWIDFAREKDGYIFRQVWDTLADPYHYDGYFANEGNKEQIDNEDVPFILKTGMLANDALSSMVLFLEKDNQLTRESMWDAILDRREVGILGEGKMLGPAYYRNALQLLLLDRFYLEDYFSDNINLQTKVDGYDLQVTVTNTSNSNVSGNLELALPAEVKIDGNSSVSTNLPAGSSKTLHFTLQPRANAMDNTNPIAVNYKWNGKTKSTLAMLDLPPAISVHRLLYGHSPKVSYPVTIHNFTNKTSFPVKVEVFNIEKNNSVFTDSQTCNAATSKFQDMEFELDLPAGNYKVKVSALGVDYTSQLGVGKAEGAPIVYAIDLNGDGVMEYRMENDSVQITLIATGARVIEYFVKSRNDNILFKHWPAKAIDDKRSFRKRGYYPYGGFEDFLGQASMETHQIYDAEIIKAEGDFVRVKMWTDYFGNRIEKTFTLYGDSPLLEVRFALDFKNPEANMLGPQPILELGKKHWTEDVFMVPAENGIVELRMMPEKYYGEAFLNIKEGWNAGYDTKEDITFVGAFPVDQPLFLHMWMNHPSNGDAHHYYTEFQPWLPIFQQSTMYFSYYIWGAGGVWENGVDDLRKRNLITTR